MPTDDQQSCPRSAVGGIATDRRTRLACVAAAALLVVNLFYLGTKPFAVGLFPAPWDKLAHFTVFSALTVLLWLGTAGRAVLGIVLLVSVFGGLDEVHQAYLPGRQADVADWLADFAGVLLAAFVLGLYARRGHAAPS